MNDKKYGLFTAITMITGIVIGSGIFFKADDILEYTNGNVLLGILIFVISAIAIIFGSLSISILAQKTDKPGGLISYAEEFINKPISAAIGWFQTFLYLPILIVIIAWVSVMYGSQLFGIDIDIKQQLLIAPVVVVIIFALNILSAKLGGYFQNISMIIKIIPLILIAVFGLVKGNPGEIISNDLPNFTGVVGKWDFIKAFAPIAFSFDGWHVSTSICNEIKNSKRNLPLSLIISPIVILFIYIVYFFGMTSLVGVQEVLELGNESTYKAANLVFGATGAKIMLIFIVISVLGTCNGLILAMIRMPYSLALRNMLPKSDKFSKESKSLNNMPLNSAILALFICIVWCGLNYVLFGINGIEVDGLSVCTGYIIYIAIYLSVFKLAKRGELPNKFYGYFVSIMAIIGSLIILSGATKFQYFPHFFICSLIIMIVGYIYSKGNK